MAEERRRCLTDSLVGVPAALRSGARTSLRYPQLGGLLAAAGLVPLAGELGQRLGQQAATPGAGAGSALAIGGLYTLAMLAILFFEAGVTGMIGQLLLGGRYTDKRLMQHGLRLFGRFVALRLLCFLAFLPLMVMTVAPLARFVFGELYDNRAAWTMETVTPFAGVYAGLLGIFVFVVEPITRSSMALRDGGLLHALSDFGRFAAGHSAVVGVLALCGMLASMWEFWYGSGSGVGALWPMALYIILRAFVTVALAAAALELYARWLAEHGVKLEADGLG